MLHKSWIKLALALLIGVGLMLGTVTVYAKTQIVQNSKTFPFGNPDAPIQGSSVNLKRTEDGVSIKVNTKDLPPGEYTNWWVIFNNPAECDSPFSCGEGDLGDTVVGTAVFFATGGSVGPNGEGKFNADLVKETLPVGPGNSKVVGPPTNANGLLFPLTAEIHYVIRYHGPFVAEDLLQDSTLGGGCTPGSTAPDSGPTGDFVCFDPQAAINLAP